MQLSESITRKSASNLALAFVLLPKPKREGMSVLYAFCREIDDIADDEKAPVEERRRMLCDWRKDVQGIYKNRVPSIPLNRELSGIIDRHGLPFELFDELIKGVEMDLEIRRYRTHQELEQYCYRVASVVGLLSIEIFGYQNPACREYAVHLGKALQLTNILRDVRGDAERGRIYLPLAELERFGVDPDEILRFQYSNRFFELAQSVARVAREFYLRARETLPPEDRRAMATAELMGSIYWKLLEKLEEQRFNVFHSSTTRLSRAQKAFLICRAWYRNWTGDLVSGYGVR